MGSVKTWINQQVNQALRDTTKNQYGSALTSLKKSFTINGTNCSFVVPTGLPDDLEITFVGLPDEKNTVVYFLDENNEEHTWKAKQTYRFDISQYQSYCYPYLAVKINGQGFDLVNVFDMLPDNMQSRNPQNRFFDSGF